MDKINKLEKILKTHPSFASFRNITIAIMKESKKAEYYGTSVKQFLAIGNEKYSIDGLIFVNKRDTQDDAKLVHIVAHEASHLTDDKVSIEEFVTFLDSKLKEGK